MLDWLTHDGRASAANGYVPLPPGLGARRTMLAQVTGPTGTHLLS